MYHQKLLVIAVLIIIGGCERCFVKNDRALTQPPFNAALAYAHSHLLHSGKLVQQPDGYAYVKVDDRYIHELFPLLSDGQGFEKPPYFRRKDSPGAHISVFYRDEHVKAEEVGKTFDFTLNNIIIVHPNKNTSYIVLQVNAPSLENLRKKYGLSPKLKNHEFHISIAVKTIK